ncbi:MAG TPA: phosphate signaling complex protein PhoU [Candidatus Polarisedimenticolia bacterium]|jgi:phosphate transport system protein|nr:phosphate signaling complex protein PhoU [Candidatus Polarisedimenticolia bacterium]
MMEHTSRQYEKELHDLGDKILFLGGTVEEMIARAMQSLVDRDSDLARRVIEMDRTVDSGELDVDHMSLNLLALRQPAASDLRFITTALKIVTDLERIGDLAVNIAERALELNQEPPLKPYIDIPHMAREVSDMVHRALDSFVKRDATEARAVLQADDAVDALNVQLFRELLTYMIEEPKNVTRALRITFIAKYLERVGDHATNIAQMVIFMSEGRDVRHPRLKLNTRS